MGSWTSRRSISDHRPQTGWQWFRLVGNVLNLTTPSGLVVALIGDAKIRRGPRGLFLCEGYRLKFPAGAFTIGNVITTGSTWEQQLRQYPELLRHEEQHSWQYLTASACRTTRRTSPVWPGPCCGRATAPPGTFERQAGLAIGGYRELPTRPVRENLAAIIRKGK